MDLCCDGFGEAALEVPVEGVWERVFFDFGVGIRAREILAFSLSLAAKTVSEKYKVSIQPRSVLIHVKVIEVKSKKDNRSGSGSVSTG